MREVKWRRILVPLGLWILVVLVFSTRTEIRGEPFVWVRITWIQALKISLAQWSAWAVLALMIIWVDRRLPIARDAIFRRVLFHLPLSIVFIVAYTYLDYGNLILLDAPRDASLVSGGLSGTLWRSLFRVSPFLYWVIVASYIAVSYQEHLKSQLMQRAELERLLSEARLNVLRSQLQPHFLFNALNAVSAHVEADPKAARLMLERLGDLLRLSLDRIDQQDIALHEELLFVEKYLQLQAMRFEDCFDVFIKVDDSLTDALVPPFILQPLVENAIHHGVSKRREHGRVTVEARRMLDRVHLTVRDNGPGLPPGWSLEHDAGIGITNTRERLRHIYGEGNQNLELSFEPEGGVCVHLDLPLRVSPDSHRSVTAA